MLSSKFRRRKVLEAHFARFVFPTILAVFISGTYQIINGIFVGNFVGADGLAGANLGWSFSVVYFGYGLLIGIGLGSLFSIAYGEEDYKQAANILGQFAFLIIVPSIIVGVFGYLYASKLMVWMGSNEVSQKMATQFLQVFSLGAPIMVGSLALPFIVRNLASPERATVFMVIGAVINILVSYLLVVIYQKGVFGAAIASLVGESIVIILTLQFIFSKKIPIKLILKNFIPQWKHIKLILINGSSGFFMYIYVGFIMLLHQKILLKYSDTSALTVYTVLGYLISIYYFIVEGIANGAQPIMSSFYGKQMERSLRTIIRMTLFHGVGLGILFTALLQLFPKFFVSLFLNEKEVEMLMDMTVHAVHFHLSLLFLEGFVIVAVLFFEALGEGYRALWIMLANMLLQIPLLFILPYFFGLDGVWLAMPITALIVTIPTLIMLQYRYKNLYLV